jgi:hypothetical protein
LTQNEKFVQIITDAKSVLSWLKNENLPELQSLENFLDYALSDDHYDLTKKDDQDILIQALNEVYQKVQQHYPLKISEKTEKNHLTIAHEKTCQEIKSTEQKVADGIKQLYHLVQEKLNRKEISYDAQGIASFYFSTEILPNEIAQKFPNALNKGITIHLFKTGFVRVPPIRHLLQTRAQSLCQAAAKLHRITLSYPGISEEKLNQLITSANGDLKLLTTEVHQEMKNTIGDVLNQLFTKYCEQNKIEHTPNNFATFTKQIMQESSNQRADQSSILTFNQESLHFSFDAGASIASHHRELGIEAANLSWICDGNFDTKQEQFSVTNSFVKNASIAPLKLSRRASSVDGWIDTYKKAIELIKYIASIRQFGRSKEDADKPMEIDFNYALLTTLAGNQQKQLQSYLHIKRALQALDGAQLTLKLGAKNPIKVRVNASVMNAGINTLQNLRVFSRAKQTVARENRKSFQRLTQAVRDYPLEIKTKDETFQRIVDCLRFNTTASLHEEMALNTDQLVQSQENLSIFNERLRENWHLYKKTKLGSDERKVMHEILTALRKDIKKENQTLDKAWRQPLEEIQRRAWNNQKTNVSEAMTYLQSPDGKKQLESLTATELQALNIYILKAKMDGLYFSGQYLEPKSGALFNAYFLLTERMTGIMSSTGCKSANDRTAIMRVMTAALSQNPQSKELDLLNQMSVNWMSNSSMFSCISDTAGGTPKVYNDRLLQGTNNFSYLAGMELANSADFGKFASHKLLDNAEELGRYYQAAKKPETSVVNRLGLFSRGSAVSKPSLSLAIETLCQRIKSQNAQESLKDIRYYNKEELSMVLYRLKADQQQISNFLSQKNLSDNDRGLLIQTLGNLGDILSERATMQNTLTMMD